MVISNKLKKIFIALIIYTIFLFLISLEDAVFLCKSTFLSNAINKINYYF